MHHLNKLLGSALEHFGHGLQTGGCHNAIEETDKYLADLHKTAADLNLLQHQITEQREAITLLMRHEGLIGDKVSDNSPAEDTAKIIPLNQH